MEKKAQLARVSFRILYDLRQYPSLPFNQTEFEETNYLAPRAFIV